MSVDVEATVREYIDKTIHMSLATTKDGKPWVCEVHFAYDGNLNLFFRSLKSRRHSQEIAANPNVAGDIVDKHELVDEVVGVYFEGAARLLEAGDEQDAAFACLRDRLDVTEAALEEAKREDGHQFYKITIDNWYVFGRFGEAVGQKHALAWTGGRAKLRALVDNVSTGT